MLQIPPGLGNQTIQSLFRSGGVQGEYACLSGKQRRFIKVQKGEPHAGGLTGIEDLAARQQTAEYRLCSQGVFWTALELVWPKN
jgi:hypothetical protein